MSTPLLRSMKNRGSSFYAFYSTNHNPNPNFSKFVLLNIPARIDNEVLDFDIDALNGNVFDIYTQMSSPTSSYADQMVESLRNYVENADCTFLESKLNARKEFYNIQEQKTPTEKLFWKWLKKFGSIEFEPAEHKVDWDKNRTDFENPNADTTTVPDYFRKYLWKERETTQYNISSIIYTGDITPGVGEGKIIIEYFAKFKVGDKIILDGGVGIQLQTGTTYNVTKVEYSGTTNNITNVYIQQSGFDSSVNPPTLSNATIELSYNKMVQYIGEINVKSDIHTASKDETEVIAYIPHQAGKTPTILFSIDTDTNYYPGLELPLLPEQIQTEIRGAENYNSPIRQNPSEYPGLYYGQFDTTNKTYKMSSGDKLRYKGDYYGILLNNNVGTQSDTYKEKLSDFDDVNIDGLGLDFNLNHYLKMNITDKQVGFNFDEFNQLSINGQPPEDFEYNAVLWYYDNKDDSGNIFSNLYGITFLNNPDTDDDIVPGHISTYVKLVSTEEHDGVSYQHVLNLSTSVDNDTSSLSFDPLSLNNTFGFDLYTNVMSNVGKLNESFINIIDEFVRMNIDLNNVKSIVYTQTDIDLIKSKLKNIEQLLKLYSQYQFVETDTVKIESKFNGVYPTLGFNVKGVEYEQITQITSTDIFNYIVATNNDMVINIPETSKLFLKITNNDETNYNELKPLGITLNRDLEYKQSIEIYLDANSAIYPDLLNISINYDDGTASGIKKTKLIDKIYLPIDKATRIGGEPLYHKNRYLSSSVFQNVSLVQSVNGITENETLLYTDAQNIFGNVNYDEWVYVNDLKFLSGETILDYSGIYQVGNSEYDYNPMYIKIPLNISVYDENNITGIVPVGVPRIYSYKYLKIKILRVDESPTSTLENRYFIEKMFI